MSIRVLIIIILSPLLSFCQFEKDTVINLDKGDEFLTHIQINNSEDTILLLNNYYQNFVNDSTRYTQIGIYEFVPSFGSIRKLNSIQMNYWEVFTQYISQDFNNNNFFYSRIDSSESEFFKNQKRETYRVTINSTKKEFIQSKVNLPFANCKVNTVQKTKRGYLVLGDSSHFVNSPGLIAEFDNELKLIWLKKMNWPCQLTSVIELENSFLISGTKGTYLTPELLSFEIDSIGKILWERTFEHKSYQVGWLEGQSVHYNGLIYNYGYVGDNLIEKTAYINSIDKNGNLIFEKYLKVGNSLEFRKIIESNNKLYAIGILDSMSNLGIFKRLAFFGEINPNNGDLIWYHIYSHEEYSEIQDLKKFKKGFILCGQTINKDRMKEFETMGYKEFDSWVLIVDSLGCFEPNCEPNYVNSIPDSKLKEISIKIFPNPATNQLKIQFNQPFELSSSNSISIYDLTGRKIYYLEKSNLEDLIINLEQELHGIYNVLVQTTSGLITKKIIFK